MIPLTRAMTTAATLTVALALTACGTTTVSSPATDTGTGTGAGTSANATPTAGATMPEPTATTTSLRCADDDTTTATGPVSLVDGVGRTVELDKPAERVVVLEWQQTEDVLSLCLTPVGIADPDGYGTYVKAEPLPASVVNVGERGEPDLDTLYGLDPDLIIVEAFSADDELIAQLEKRDVPVLATKGADAAGQIDNMKNVFATIATATGRTERAEQVLARFDEHLAAAKAEVADVTLPTTDFLFFDGWIEGGNVVIRPYGKGALFTELGQQLGLTPAWTDEIDAAYGSGGVDPAYGLAQTDLEGLTAVGDANLFYSDDDTPDSYVGELDKSPVWTSLPAVQEGRAHPFPAGVWGAGGPLSNIQAIDAYVDILTKG